MDSTSVISRSILERINQLETSSPYGYIPAKAPGYAYIVVFTVATIIHLALAIRYKYWVALVTVFIGGLLEIMGWAARLWSSYNVLNSNPFLMQMCCLILGPTFFSAWAYTVLGYCIPRLGRSYSLLKPGMYLLVFVCADIISLVLQAIGGGMSAVAAEDGTSTTVGTRIMLAGILFQLGTMTIFVLLAVDFSARVILHKPHQHIERRLFEKQNHQSQDGQTEEAPRRSGETTPVDTEQGPTTTPKVSSKDQDPKNLRKVEYLLAGVAFASIMIYVRGIYRAIELAQGWEGYLITHEAYFIYLDGLPMALCLYSLAALYPGWLLPRRTTWT